MVAAVLVAAATVGTDAMAIDTKLKLKLMMQDFPALLILEGFPVSSGSQTGVDSEAENVQLKRGKGKKGG